MSSIENAGYRGASAQVLQSAGVRSGDRVIVSATDGQIDGILMPRYESAGENHIVIKLKSGYNVGINISKIKSIERLPEKFGTDPPSIQSNQAIEKTAAEIRQIALISTGGTIASKIDYRTGGVRAALTAQELYESVPELGKIASVHPQVLFSEYSENLTPSHWTQIAEEVTRIANQEQYNGIVISHGTDTMHYTASALSFALQGIKIPVVLVGAQRSSDRPSSDAASNLLGAATFAAGSHTPGVFIAMHQGTDDDGIACHVGTRVRKNHTSRRDAFESIDLPPAAIIKGENIELAQSWKNRISNSQELTFSPKPNFDNNVCIIKYYPGFNSNIIDHAVSSKFKALILEGTGLGHIGRQCFGSIKAAIDSGVLVFMTSQCIWGRVRMTVYDTGRDLLDIGVVPLSDMLSETALTKAMWSLANSDSPDSTLELMRKNLAHEISEIIPL